MACRRAPSARRPDFAKKEKNTIEELRKSDLLSKGHVLTCDTYAAKPEADIEDLFGNAGYLDLTAPWGSQGPARSSCRRRRTSGS